MAGDAFLNRLAADPAIRLLLMSYELLAVDRRLLAEEALDAVVATSMITASTSSSPRWSAAPSTCGSTARASGAAVEAVRHDLEEALRAG